MILAPRNDDVHVLNHNMIDSFHASPENTKVYHSADNAIIWDELSNDIPVEFLNTINVSGMPVSKLTPKVGCPAILCPHVMDSVCGHNAQDSKQDLIAEVQYCCSQIS